MMYASRNQTVTLPAVPKAKGYTNLGWTTVKGDTTVEYNEGDTVKITKSVQFYAVRRKSKYYTVNYYLGNGSSNSAYKKLKPDSRRRNSYYICKKSRREPVMSIWLVNQQECYKSNNKDNLYGKQKCKLLCCTKEGSIIDTSKI